MKFMYEPAEVKEADLHHLVTVSADQISSEFHGPVTFADRSPDKRRIEELRAKTPSRAANSAVWRGDASACCASLESESGDKAIRLEGLSNKSDPVFWTSLGNAVEEY